MKTKYLWLVLACFFAVACDNGSEAEADQERRGFEEERQFTKEERLKIIGELEAKAFANDTAQLKRALANDLMQNYFEYRNLYPKDSLSPQFLFKGGEVAMAIGKHYKAIEVFETIYEGYPDFDKRVESLNLIAFNYDYYLKDSEMARKFYEIMMQNHPDHPYAQDAAARLTTLGMSDEELIEHFEKLNANNSDTL